MLGAPEHHGEHWEHGDPASGFSSARSLSGEGEAYMAAYSRAHAEVRARGRARRFGSGTAQLQISDVWRSRTYIGLTTLDDRRAGCLIRRGARRLEFKRLLCESFAMAFKHIHRVLCFASALEKAR
jgi:hypothetical protein